MYYRNLIFENGQDSKILWQVPGKALHRILGKVFPSHESKNSLALADDFVSFLLIRSLTFLKHSHILILLRFLMKPPGFLAFEHVLQEEIEKRITKSPTKSCL